MNTFLDMNRILLIIVILIFTVTVTSCGSTLAIQKDKNEVASYTIKNKQELMEQKVFNKNMKTVIVIP